MHHTPIQQQVPWFVRLGEHWHPLLLPVVVAALCFLPFRLLDSTDSVFVDYGMSPRQILGTSLLFCILPGYVLCVQFYAWRVARDTVIEFAPLTPAHAQGHAAAALARPGWWMLPVVVLGALLGTHDFSELDWLLTIGDEVGFDLWFRAMAMTGWAFVFWLLCWRSYCAHAMYRLGEKLNIDVYQLDGLNRFVRLPLLHLLIIVGAFVLMPLQSLDFQVRWINYRSGVSVGLLALLLFVAPPIWGLHKNMRDRIAERITQLQSLVNDCDRENFPRLALLIEHRETVRDFTSWPLDVGLVGKLLLYLIIPPLAWVAAALVERLVDKVV